MFDADFYVKKGACRVDAEIYCRFEEPGVNVSLAMFTTLALLLQKEGKLMKVYIIIFKQSLKS